MFMKCMFMHGGSLLISPWFIYMNMYMYLFCAGPPNTISLSELHDNTHGPLHLHVHVHVQYTVYNTHTTYSTVQHSCTGTVLSDHITELASSL